MSARTGAERYFDEQRSNPEHAAAYNDATERVAAIDMLVRSLDERRQERGLSKAELARLAGIPAETVRRLFTMRTPNPTATTLIALARALDLDLVAAPRRASPARRGTPRTRRAVAAT